MLDKNNLIIKAEEAFARKVALAVIVTTPKCVWYSLIPFMFIFDFLGRMSTTRNYTAHFMFPRKLAIRAAQDILQNKNKGKAIAEAAPEVENWLSNLKLSSPMVQNKQMAQVEILTDHYLKLLTANGESYEELVRYAYDNRQKYIIHLNHLASSEEELNMAILEKVGEDIKVKEKMSAEREQMERMNEKRVNEIFQTDQ